MILAVGIMAVSCAKSPLEPTPAPDGGNDISVAVSLRTALPDATVSSLRGSGPQASRTGAALSIAFGEPTKAAESLTTDGEQKVTDLWVVQFDKATGKRVGTPYYASGEQIVQNGADISLEARLTSASSSQVVYFVANTHSPSTFHAGNCTTITDLEKVSGSIGTGYRPTASSGLPMLAAVEFPQVASGTPLTGITLRRLVAKVVLRYKVSAALAARGFAVIGARLRNVPAAIRYATEPTGSVDYPALAQESHIDYALDDVTSAGTDGVYSTFTWYMPENLRKAMVTVSEEQDRVPANTDGAATYIEIQGELKSPLGCQRVAYTVMLGNVPADMNDYNVRRNNIYTASMELLGTNVADKRITVESFDMNNSAIVVPNSGAKGAVTFDIRKCLNNSFTTQAGLSGMLGTSSTLTADVLWQDGNVINTSDVTLDAVNGLLTVKSSKATVGNAIVALYPNASKNQGDILWSWQVWVTDYQPDGSTNYALAANSRADVPGGQVHTYGTNFMSKNPGKVIMDRNLGAAKAYYAAPSSGDATAADCFGMFYQWGRKDPFPRVWGATIHVADAIGTTIPIYGADGTTVLPEDGTGYKKVAAATALSGANTLAYAVKNPLTFIYNATGTIDWYTTTTANQNNTLWGDGAQKSAYDPCPKGWRIAADGTWNDFTRTAANAGTFLYWEQGVQSEAVKFYATNGRVYAPARAWYPAPGYRYSATGGLLSVGNQGFSWSSSVSSFNGINLNFNYAGVITGNPNGRANGFQVRCIQE